jgi:hypothetical protein
MAKKDEEDKKKIGRPSAYTKEIGDQICTEISTSNKSLRTICKELTISVTAVLGWLSDGKHKEFTSQYARAKEEQADFLAEEIIEIADDSSNDTMTIEGKHGPIELENKEWTSRSKLRVEARKWIASKLKPKKYGDKIEQDVNLKGEISVTLNLD